MAQSSEAADHYIRDGATGSSPCNADGWNSACDSLPAALVRGDTYYIAGGTYGSHTFNDSGTTVITIKGATASDHGSDAGWLNSYGVDVNPANLGAMVFSAGYYTINGQVGQWASDLPNYVPYGFRILSSSSSAWTVIKIGVDDGGQPWYDHITFRHVEGGYTGNWGENQDIFYIHGHNATVQYCWFHDAGRCNITEYHSNNLLVEYSVLERNGQADAHGIGGEHSEIYAMQIGGDNNVFRYNIIRDGRSTGWLIGHEENHSLGTITNYQIYGNIFVDTGYYPANTGGGNGVIGGQSAQTNATFYIYNNSFVNLRYGGVVCTMGGFSDLQIKNNLFYNVHYYDGSSQGPLQIGGSHSYNWFYGSGAQSETGIQNGIGDPFVNLLGKDYRLSAATNAGAILSSPYNLDILENIRGSDSVWDRGAYEYASSGDTTPPAAPSGLSVQ